jgi:1-deoxy-D-xylulose-5-phosphate reductoisomerase
VPGAAAGCDWSAVASWDFEPLDEEAFPAVALCRRAGAAGGTVPAVLNAANEVCVDAFRAGSLPFLGIVDTVARVVEEHLTERAGGGDRVLSTGTPGGLTVDDVLAADAWARERAAAQVDARTDE